MSGIHMTVAASGATTNVVPFIKGTAGSNEGVADNFGNFGTFVGNRRLTGDRVITGYYNTFDGTELSVAGSQLGAWWTSVTVNGTTYNRADAITPNGTTDGTHTYWTWTTKLTVWPSSGLINVI